MKFRRLLSTALALMLVIPPNISFAQTLPTGAGESPSNPGFFYPGKSITIPAPQGVDPSLTYIGVMLHRMQPSTANDTNAANYTAPVSFNGKEEWYIPASGTQDITINYNNTDVKAFFASAKYGSIIYPDDPRQTPTNLVTNNSIFKLNAMYLFRLSDGTDKKGAIRSMFIQLAPVPTAIKTKWGAYKQGQQMNMTVDFSQKITIKSAVKMKLSNGSIVTSNESSGSHTSLTFTYTVTSTSSKPLKVVAWQNASGTDITNSRNPNYHDFNTTESYVQWIIPEDFNLKDGTTKYVSADATNPDKYTGTIGNTANSQWVSQVNNLQLKSPSLTDAHSGVVKVEMRIYDETDKPITMPTNFVPDAPDVTGVSPAKNIYKATQTRTNIDTGNLHDYLESEGEKEKVEATLKVAALLTDSVGYQSESNPVNLKIDTWAPEIPLAWRGKTNTIHMKIREHMSGVKSVQVQQRAENGNLAPMQSVSLTTLLQDTSVTDKTLANWTLGFTANQDTNLYPGAVFYITDNAGNTNTITIENLNSPAEVSNPLTGTHFLNGDPTSIVTITASIKDEDSTKIGFNLLTPQINSGANLLTNHMFIQENMNYSSGVTLNFPVTMQTLASQDGIYNDLRLVVAEYLKQTSEILYTDDHNLPLTIVADKTSPTLQLEDSSKSVGDGKTYLDIEFFDDISGVSTLEYQFKGLGNSTFSSVSGQLLNKTHPKPDSSSVSTNGYSRIKSIYRRLEVTKSGTYQVTATDKAGNKTVKQIVLLGNEVDPNIGYRIDGVQTTSIKTIDKLKDIAIAQNVSPNPILTMSYTDFSRTVVPMTTVVRKEDGKMSEPIYNTLNINQANGISQDILIPVQQSWGRHFQIINTIGTKVYETDMFLLTGTIFYLQSKSATDTNLSIEIAPEIKDKVPTIANTKLLSYTKDASNSNYEMFGESPIYKSATSTVYKNRGLYYSKNEDVPTPIQTNEFKGYSVTRLAASVASPGTIPKAAVASDSSLTVSGLWTNEYGMDAPQSVIKEDDFNIAITVKPTAKQEPFNPDVGIVKKGYTIPIEDAIPWGQFPGFKFTYYILCQQDYTGDWSSIISNSDLAANATKLSSEIKAPMLRSSLKSYIQPENISGKLLSKSGTYYVLVEATSQLGGKYYGANTINVLLSEDTDNVQFKNTSSYRINRAFLLDITTANIAGHTYSTAPLTYKTLFNDNKLYVSNKGAASLTVYDSSTLEQLQNIPLTGTMQDMCTHNGLVYVVTTSGLYEIAGTTISTKDTGSFVSVASWGSTLLTATANKVQARLSPNSVSNSREVLSNNIKKIDTASGTVYVTLSDGKVLKWS